jgi:hypothetical protein
MDRNLMDPTRAEMWVAVSGSIPAISGLFHHYGCPGPAFEKRTIDDTHLVYASS